MGLTLGKLLSPEQAAEAINVTPAAIREWLRTGELQGLKAGRLWRIRKNDLENFLKQKEVGITPEKAIEAVKNTVEFSDNCTLSPDFYEKLNKNLEAISL